MLDNFLNYSDVLSPSYLVAFYHYAQNIFKVNNNVHTCQLKYDV